MRVLVVCGSRALDDTLAARRWALRILAERLFAGDVDVVVTGYCRRSPDVWADTLAHNLIGWGTVVHVIRWPITDRVSDYPEAGRLPYKIVNGHFVPLQNADRYPYSGPLPRNAAMMTWAKDQRDAGHVVAVLALHAPWATTGGTAHAVGCARSRGLDVVEYTAPRECGP